MRNYNATASETISITDNNTNTTIKHVSTDAMRILVDSPITTSNESHDVELFYQDKIKDYILHLKIILL